MPALDPLPATPPLIIGATGGSGTRVFARLAQLSGYELGAKRNQAEDAITFQWFHDRWIDRLLAAGEGIPRGLEADFRATLARHLAAGGPPPAALSRWGWKAPRTIYFLRFFHGLWPGMKFIHVVRDGRDMAVSTNQNQLNKHGRAVLGWWTNLTAPRAVRSIGLWARINAAAAAYGETQLGENYLRVRFEDLCRAPAATVAQVLAFLGGHGDAEAIAAAEVRPPATLGRWREEPPELVARCERVAGAALQKFGYRAP
jgi:hypothetical protein